MPKLTVEGVGEFEVPQGKRMVLALEDEAKIDQLHACGGNARCTTCRVEFIAARMQNIDFRVLLDRQHQSLVGGDFECSVPFNGQFSHAGILSHARVARSGPFPLRDRIRARCVIPYSTDL